MNVLLIVSVLQLILLGFVIFCLISALRTMRQVSNLIQETEAAVRTSLEKR